MTNCIRLPKILTLVLWIFVLSLETHAQHTGYYVNLTHDTIRGSFPHYIANELSPTSVTFQPSSATQSIDLRPGNCLVIAIDHSDKFIAYHGQRLTNPATDAQAQTGARADEFEDVDIFIRELYNDGKFRLYKYTDARRSNFFVGGDILQELYYKTYLENRQVKEALQFRQQLVVLFRDQIDADPLLKAKLEYTGYTEANLLFFFTAATGHLVKEKDMHWRPRFFIGVGISVNFFTVDAGDMTVYNINGRFKTNYSPVFQAGVQYPVGRGSDRFFLHGLIQGYSFNNSKTSPYLGRDTYKGVVLSAQPGIGYKIVETSTLSIALSAALGSELLISNSRDHVDDANAAQSYHTDNAGSFHFTGHFGVEFFLGKFSLAPTYMLPIGTANYFFYYPKHSAAQLTLRYGL